MADAVTACAGWQLWIDCQPVLLLMIIVHKCQWWSTGDGGVQEAKHSCQKKKLLRLQIHITVNAQTDHKATGLL